MIKFTTMSVSSTVSREGENINTPYGSSLAKMVMLDCVLRSARRPADTFVR